MLSRKDLKIDMIVRFEKEDHRIVKITEKTIKLEGLCGYNRFIKFKKGWNFRISITFATVKEFKLMQELYWLNIENEQSKSNAEWYKEQVVNRDNEIQKLKSTKQFPYWFNVKRNTRLCTKERLLEVIEIIHPFASSIHLDYGINHGSESEKWPYYYTIKASSRGCTKEYLESLIEATKSIGDALHLDYGAK